MDPPGVVAPGVVLVVPVGVVPVVGVGVGGGVVLRL